ncbi:hypothetical protein PCASD_05459 [Puccinia coronata f. sp. avenae]|uniref:Uncharacterized protein n=1 Tax=Puccinia coronata f. sp. avenae TaxID=200324 RepID=A0A2N5V8S3_9BASI|nr:hypothetical protein PCASD_05459 [Puccinia coronata f. sp. avenae]
MQQRWSSDYLVGSINSGPAIQQPYQAHQYQYGSEAPANPFPQTFQQPAIQQQAPFQQPSQMQGKGQRNGGSWKGQQSRGYKGKNFNPNFQENRNRQQVGGSGATGAQNANQQ